jgi:uncharacterized protein (TIGR02246 family)
MRTVICCAALISLLSLLACSAPQPQMDMAQMRQAVEASNAKFCEAFNAGDAAALAAMYTEDAIVMPPNQEMAQGTNALQQTFGGFFSMGAANLALTTSDVMGSGDLVVETGKYNIALPGGIQDSGKYLVVWKKAADGSWKLHRDIWNSSLPLPGAPMSGN